MLQAGQPASPAEPDDPKGWKLGGLPDDPTSDEFKRRNKHPGGDKFSLAPSLLAYLPKLNLAGLSVARDFIKGKTTSLTNTFFQKAFPEEAQDIILEGVRSYSDRIFSLRFQCTCSCFRTVHTPTRLQ